MHKTGKRENKCNCDGAVVLEEGRCLVGGRALKRQQGQTPAERGVAPKIHFGGTFKKSVIRAEWVLDFGGDAVMKRS